jgi:MarR family transcriptional regulator, transcriptional regulator for hemolysin
LAVIARQVRMSFDQSVERKGFTRAKWTLIAAVAGRPGATQRMIAEVLEVRETTAGRLIDRLCAEGFLRRCENPNDRRSNFVYLSAASQPLLQKLEELAQLHEAALFADFDAEALQALDTLLGTMIRNLPAARCPRAPAK